MPDSIRAKVLETLRVPHDPDPPAGGSGSLQVFRAGKNFYKLRFFRWVLAQIGALLGIVASLIFIGRLEQGFDEFQEEARKETAAKQAAASQPAPATVPNASTTASSTTIPAKNAAPNNSSVTPANTVSTEKAATPEAKTKNKSQRRERERAVLRRVVSRAPSWSFVVIRLFEWFGILFYVVQIPFTYAMVRLDYELRWYMVTDRSLRIRSGLTSIQETTMSFANVQQVVVSQGPLQRLLGIADVHVQSAGGGGGGEDHKGHGNDMHMGVFHSVENAPEIRDLILARLRQFRETGLGDPDEARASAAPSVTALGGRESATVSADAVLAAHELLAEARALRQALAG